MKKVMNYVHSRTLGLMVAALVFVCDWLSKSWVLAHQPRLPIDVIAGCFSIVLAWNRGISFSFLADVGAWGPVALGMLAVVACVWFVHWMGTLQVGSSRGVHQLGLGLLTGGALGNLLDRINHGAVVDFLFVYAHRWGSDWYFPVFNLADSAISLGVALLLWDSVRQGRRDKA